MGVTLGEKSEQPIFKQSISIGFNPHCRPISSLEKFLLGISELQRRQKKFIGVRFSIS